MSIFVWYTENMVKVPETKKNMKNAAVSWLYQIKSELQYCEEWRILLYKLSKYKINSIFNCFVLYVFYQFVELLNVGIYVLYLASLFKGSKKFEPGTFWDYAKWNKNNKI